MPGSVRLRLTLIVSLTTLVALSVAVWFGTEQVRDSLIDDAVAADVDNLKLIQALECDVGEQCPISPFEMRDAATALRIIREDPESESFYDALSLDPSDPIPVRFSDGSVRTVIVAQSMVENFDVGVYTGDGPIVDVFTLYELSFEREDASDIYLTGELRLRLDDLVFVSREVNGTDFIVAVDIRRTLVRVDDFRAALWITTGVLVLLAAITTWIMAGRVLAPVRRITARAGEISGGTLHERVPVPDTSDEIAELGSTLNTMLDRLELADQKRRQFVSDASHEFRTPVTVLRSEAEVALRLPDDTDTEDLAKSVLAESERMGRLVEDLLALARSDEGTASPAGQRPVDLDDIVFAEAARSRRLPVDQRAVSAGRVIGGVDQLTRMVAHLLDNAARHGKTLVAVGLAEEDGQVMLWVDDDGDGILPSDRQKVFERFARLEDARSRDTGGAGLGLAVVASTVADLGGTVEVGVAPLGGARFVVRFPAAS